MRAVIVGGANICNYNFYKDFFKEDDFIICADGGINHLIKLKIKPNVFLGDFDSCDFDAIKNLKILNNAIIKKHSIDKNETDTFLAVSEAVSRGFKEIAIIGGIGLRSDHSIANISILKYILDHESEGVIVDENNEIRLIDRPAVITPRKSRYISLIPFTPTVSGLTLKGLKFPLDNFDLCQGDTIGISNEFTEKDAEIYFDSGMLLVIIAKD